MIPAKKNNTVSDNAKRFKPKEEVFTKTKKKTQHRNIPMMFSHAHLAVLKEVRRFVLTAEIKKFSFESILSTVFDEAIPRFILTSSSSGSSFRASSYE